jgi:hypothetical protein
MHGQENIKLMLWCLESNEWTKYHVIGSGRGLISQSPGETECKCQKYRPE